MKKLIMLALIAVNLSSCYQITYDSTLNLGGVVVDQDGKPQSFDLNEKTKICVQLSFDKPLDGYPETHCRAFSSSKSGEFYAIFSPSKAGVADYIGLKPDSEINVNGAKTYLILASGETIEGEVSSYTKLNDKQYQATAKFILNKSNYTPDQTIDINSSNNNYKNQN